MSLPRLIKFADLEKAGIVKSWPALKYRISTQGFPPGRLLGKSRVWTEDEVRVWLDNRPVEPQPLRGRAAELVAAKTAREKSEAV